MYRTILALIVVVAASACVVPAHAHKHRHARHADLSPELVASLKDFHTSTRQWTRETMLPTLVEWKQQVDAALAADDLATLNTLRARATALRTEGTTLRTAMQQARQLGDTTAADRYCAQLRELFGKRRALVDELEPIIDTYDDELTALYEQARPTLREWRKQQHERTQEWAQSAASLARTEADQKFLEHLREHPGGKRHGHRHGYRAVVRFLLWDGTGDIDEAAGPGEAFATSVPQEAARDAVQHAIAPNPADQNTTLTFTLPAESPVVLTLHTLQGDIVLTPLDSRLGAGEHTVRIPTATLAAGRYYYTLRTGTATSTGSISVVH